MDKKELIKLIGSMIDNLSTMQEHIKNESYHDAYEYTDGIINDSGELQASIENLL